LCPTDQPGAAVEARQIVGAEPGPSTGPGASIVPPAGKGSSLALADRPRDQRVLRFGLSGKGPGADGCRGRSWTGAS
jgi:hypothetical protein